MSCKCNKIEELLKDIYGNEDNWLEYESNGYHLIGINYEKKIELLNRLLKDIENNKFVSTATAFGDVFTHGILNSIKSDIIYGLNKEIDESINQHNKIYNKDESRFPKDLFC